MSAKGWRGILTRADDVPPTADVIDLPVQRPSADSLFEAVRSAQRERRQIEKEGRAIMQRLEDCNTRICNARAALIERMGEVGIKAETGE